MKNMIVLSAMLMLGTRIEGQTAVPYLGVSRPTMLRTFGRPDAVVSTTTHKVYGAAAHDRMLLSSGTVIDSYIKRYRDYEFSIDVLYRLDGTTSRLHPVERVGSVIYTPDNKKDFIELLNALPVTKQFCHDGCMMMLFRTYSSGFKVVVYSKVPSQQERELAGKLATGYSKSLHEETAYVPSMEVTFQDSPRFSGEEASVESYRKLIVDTIRLEVTDLASERESAGAFKEMDLPPT